ncbi:MAG: PAS domain-containing protein [Chloroflexales bacterium]|nr:PAS domain-containing protein [Chloroflexales bacterium]
MEPAALRILIVDDSPEDRLTLRRLLTRAAPGISAITEADRGDRALAACRESLPDCVLLDYRLPDMDGLAVLAAIRAQSDVSVVLLTGVGSEALAVDALKRGAQDYLVKGTLTPERLSLTIQHAIATVRLTRERDRTLALLTTMLDTLPIGVSLLDADLRLLHVNAAMATALGAPGQALVGQRFPVCRGNLAAALASYCAQVLATGQPIGPLEIVTTTLGAAAEPHTWQVGLYPLCLPATGQPGLGLVVQELTALVQATAASQAQAQWLRLALDAAQLVAWEWDVTADTLTYSTSEASYFRLPPAQRTRPRSDLLAALSPPDRPRYEQLMSAALARGGPYEIQLRVRAPNDQLCWLEARGFVQHNADAQAVRVVGITRDISAEKRREAAQTLHLAISQALHPGLDEAATLQALGRLPLPELADTCTIYLRDDAGQVLPASAYAGNPAAPLPLPQLPTAGMLDDESALVTTVLQTGAARRVTDLPQAPGQPQLRSALLIPLAVQDHRLGVMVLGRSADRSLYDDAELALAEGLARRGAEALLQARLRAEAEAAQQAAAAAHARLDALIRSTPSGIAYLDRELRYVLVNPALAALNGQVPAEHLGRTLPEIVPNLASWLEPYVRQVLETGLAAPAREVQETPCPGDGMPHDWLINAFPVMGPPGSVAGVGVMVTDVTTTRRTAAALRDSQQNLTALIENTDGVVWSVDADYRLIVCNTRLQHELRTASGREVTPGDCLMTLDLPQALLDEWRTYYDRALAGETFSVDLPTRTTPEARMVEYRFSPIRTAEGEIAGATVFSRDITERLRTAQALRETERKLGALFELLPVGIAILDATGAVVYVNPALEQILRLDRASLLRGDYATRRYLRSDGSSMPPEEFASVRAVRAQQPVSNIEIGMVIEGGAVIWTSVSAAPVDFPDWQVVIVTTDITEHKRAEQALRESEALLRQFFEHAGSVVWVKDVDGRFLQVNRWTEAILATPREALLGHRVDEVFPQAAADLYRNNDRQVLAANRAMEFEETATLDGHVHTFLATKFPLQDKEGRLFGLGAICTDITARKDAEEQLRAALDAEQTARAAAEAASARTARLQALTARLAGALTHESVIQAITDHGVTASGAVAAVLGLLDTAGAQLEVAIWIGDHTPAADWPTLSLDSLWPPSVVVRTGEPIWLASQREAEFHFPGLGPIMTRFGHHALAVLPVQSSNQVLGVMSFSYAIPNPFPFEERAFLLALTQLCAQALERAQLYTEVLQSRERLQHLSERLVAVQEEERRHLARELHDEIGQTLSALSLTLGTVSSQAPPALAGPLVAAQRQVADLVAQVRQRSLDLRPAMLDDLGLRPALVWYLGRYQEQAGIRLDVELQGLTERFAPPVELTAYRIVQEALTNIARHAGVDHATVLVWVASKQLMLEVIDSGRGFNLEVVGSTYASNGLAGMGERVALLGGEMVIESEPGAGTRLFASLPLAPPQSGREEPR